jgi:fibronectin type III domain protein
VTTRKRLRASFGRRPWAIALVISLVLVGVGSGLVLNHYYKPRRADPTASPTPDVVTVTHKTIKACTAVTTCVGTAVTIDAYSSLYVFVSAISGTGPSGITQSRGPAIGAADRHIAQASTAEEYVYHLDNESSGAAITVTVNFTASTTYTIGELDVANVRTVSFDAVGSGSTSSGSGTASDSVTTTVVNDLVLLGVSTGVTRAMAASGGDAAVQFTANGGQFSQTDASTGSITLSATFTSTSWAAVAIAMQAASVPAAPISLAAGTVTTTTVPLTWSKAAGAGPDVNNTVYVATYSSGACGAYSTVVSAGAVSAFTVTGLTTRTAYCFKVTQWNTTGESAASTAITNIQTANVPLALTGLTVAPVLGSTTSLQVSWTVPASDTGIVNETVYQSNGGSCTGAPTTTSFGIGTVFFANSLTANTQYSYTVQAWNATGASVQSSCVAATTYATPSAPTGLGVTATTTTTVALAWTNPGGSLVNDTVYYGTACGTWTAQLSTGGVASAYTVTGLAPFTSYCFEVSAWSAGAQSALSTSQTDKTLTVVPGAPTGLVATPASPTSLTLTWTNPSVSSGSLLNNTVYSGTSCSTLSTVTSTIAAVQTYTLTGLSAGTTYCLRVSAWTQAGEGGRSTFANGTTQNAIPSAPTALAYVSASHTAITISWTNPVATLVNDTVYWKAGATCATGATGISASVTTTYTVNALTAATQYCFVVTAWTNGGQSSQSSAVTGFTQGATPPAPINLRTFQIGSTWANVVWTNPAGYTLFNNSIYWKQTTCGPAWTTILSAGSVVASYNITGLTAGQTYCITVTAWDGESPHSAGLFLNTSGGASGTPPGGCPVVCRGGPSPSQGFGGGTTEGPLGWILLIVGSLFFVSLLAIVLVGKRSDRRSGGRQRGGGRRHSP